MTALSPRPLCASSGTTRLLISFAVVALIALRKSDSLTNPQFWAEDGALFFIEAERHGGWSLLFHPYEGYLHLLPRLVAALGTYLPLLDVPAFYAWSSLILTGVIAWWLQSPRLRLPCGRIAALALALVPHNGEVFLTLCNLQWITALGLFALTIARDPPSLLHGFGDLALLIFTGLTGPFVLLALPLFAWRTWDLRSRWSSALFIVSLACAIAHLPAILARTAPTDAPPWLPLHHLAIIGRRVFGTLFLGHLPLGEIVSALLALAAAASLVVVLSRKRRELPGGLFLLTAAALVVIATGYKVRPDTWTLSELGNGDRYFFIPKIILLWLLAALAVTATSPTRPVLLAVLALPLISNGPRFFIAAAPDQNWKNSCALIARGEPVWVPILPQETFIFHPGRRPAH